MDKDHVDHQNECGCAFYLQQVMPGLDPYWIVIHWCDAHRPSSFGADFNPEE